MKKPAITLTPNELEIMELITIAVISSLINDKDITAQDIREIEAVIEAKKSKLK